MLAIDRALHHEVTDGGAVQADEGSAVVIDELAACLLDATTVVSQRVVVSVEDAAEGLRLAADAHAAQVDVGGQPEILATVAFARSDIDCQLLPVGSVLDTVGRVLRSATFPCPCHLPYQEQHGQNTDFLSFHICEFITYEVSGQWSNSTIMRQRYDKIGNEPNKYVFFCNKYCH